MNALELQLCDIQGRLFELSVDRNLDSARFIKIFMNSETARALDSTYNRMQRHIQKIRYIGSDIFIDIGIIIPASPVKKFINRHRWQS